MAKKFHIILIIFTLGFFATPMLAYACGVTSKKTEKHCCKKKAEKDNKKDYYKNHKSKNNNNHDDCKGKCKHSSCICTTVHFAFNLPFFTEIILKIYVIESKKLKFYHNETYFSSGFYSIWIPPKIG